MRGVEEEAHRNATIARVSLWILAGNLALGAVKVAAGLLFQSLGILGDGLDSLGDVLAAVTTLMAVKVMSRPPDADHPWGHQRADTIATNLLTFIMFFFGAQLFTRAATELAGGVQPPVPSQLGIVVLLASIAAKILLATFLFSVGKKTNSSMLRANAQNMLGDVALSGSVLLGVILSVWFESGWIDIVTALAVSLWIMATAVRGFNRTNLELMDGLREPEVYGKVFRAVDGVVGAHNPHRVRIRRFADRLLIDLDVEMDGGLALRETHELGRRVECAIHRALPEVYDIMLHIEPFGNKESERYGLSRSDF